MNKSLSLTPIEKYILEDKGTEPSFSGSHLEKVEQGSFLCRACGKALFRADNQFTSTCGWPSFDDELQDTIARSLDNDGRRTEITCARCHGHLGHVFAGENLTEKNQRHCVNSLSIEFVADENVIDTEEAIIAGGCFWGVEALFEKVEGVLLTQVGYIGGELEDPTYEEVCRKTTGHIEAIRVVYDPARIDYSTILKLFFEIHDFTQTNGQGPDLGPQYLSAIFYFDSQQKSTAKDVIEELKHMDYSVATQLYPMSRFWPAEDYHQDYYTKTGKQPYCHVRKKIFK